MLILLIFTLLGYALGKVKFKSKPKKVLIKPLPKDFDNYYMYLNALAEYENNCWNEFVKECEKGNAIYIEREVFNKDLQNKYDDLKNILK